MEHRFVILLHAQDALTKAASRLQRIRARTHTRRNRGNNEVLSTCKAHRLEIIWRQIISLGVPNLQRSGPARACPMQPFRFFSWSECIFFPLQLFQSCKANCHETLMKVSQEHIHPTDFFKSLVSILMHPKAFLSGRTHRISRISCSWKSWGAPNSWAFSDLVVFAFGLLKK